MVRFRPRPPPDKPQSKLVGVLFFVRLLYPTFSLNRQLKYCRPTGFTAAGAHRGVAVKLGVVFAGCLETRGHSKVVAGSVERLTRIELPHDLGRAVSQAAVSHVDQRVVIGAQRQAQI